MEVVDPPVFVSIVKKKEGKSALANRIIVSLFCKKVRI